MARQQPEGRVGIYKRADGLYHAEVPTGERYPNGKSKRKHVKRSTREAAVEAVQELEAKLRGGRDITVKADTYGEWLLHWIDNIILMQVRMRKKAHSTYVDYEKIVRVHLLPKLGGYKLVGRKGRLEPEHHEELYAQLAESGMAGSYIRKIHYVAQRSQKEAYRRGKADRIVTDLMDPPEYEAEDIQPLPLAHAQAVLSEAVSNRDGLAARWGMGVLQGDRQGEVLGLRWPQLVLDPDSPDDVPHRLGGKQLQRRKWLHGCGDSVACNQGAARRDRHSPCKREWCPPKYTHGCAPEPTCGKKLAHFCPAKRVMPGECSKHERVEYCAPCPVGCTGHASTCPERTGGGLVEADPKTRAARATNPIGDVVVELLRRHREEQIRLLGSYGLKLDPEGYVFIDTRVLRHGDPTSVKPINPRTDWGLWQELQGRAGIAKGDRHRLHAARHTTGTYLRATGADLKMVADVLRQASLVTAANYSDSVMAAQRDAINRMIAALVDGDLSKIIGAQRGAVS